MKTISFHASHGRLRRAGRPGFIGIALACALVGSAGLHRARAIEVALEENKLEKGSVGFVDLKRLFKLYPETQKAKLGFEDSLRQTEEQINLRRSEIIGLRAEIARLKAEKEFVQKSSAATAATLPPGDNLAAARSTDTVHGPGSSKVPYAVSPATAPASAANINQTSFPAGPKASSPAPSAPNADVARLKSLDDAIAEKSKALESKEAEFKAFEAQAEKNLLDLESRKTEILLGQIYGAIQEVARSERISVVVDKGQILFGHQGVDLTEKVLQKLKNP